MSAITTVNMFQQYFVHDRTSEPAANQSSERGRFNITSPQIALLSQPRPVSLKMTKQRPRLPESSSWGRFSSSALAKVESRKVGHNEPCQTCKVRRRAKARVPLGAWWAESPWLLKRLPWQRRSRSTQWDQGNIGQAGYYQHCRVASQAPLIIWWWMALIGALWLLHNPSFAFPRLHSARAPCWVFKIISDRFGFWLLKRITRLNLTANVTIV